MMRTLAESKSRWNETVNDSISLSKLQRAFRFSGSSSPCVSGHRSVCWKAFLLSRRPGSAFTPADWSHVLLESRASYSAARDRHLRFIKHPDQLTQLTVDPLADDPDSPWDAVRKDELIRSEIRQDVERLPDEPVFYHKESVQTMILDILFLYGKLNPSMGGYRQGMHELLAPILYVVAQDAIDRACVVPDDLLDEGMLAMLDSFYVQHDAYALFASVMEQARFFYEVGSADEAGLSEQSHIVARSRHIHEELLMSVDPDLANHLKEIEILPQIFLTRWIRLLFVREFPFDELLVFWDALFSLDPSLELVNLICVAMLIRIRWTLLGADCPNALSLLLKYPAPDPAHGPHTFIDDAVYLRDHLNVAGGSTVIFRYTSKVAAVASPVSAPSTRSSTPTFSGLSSLRQRTLRTRSPLSSSARLLQQSGGIEALFQVAAKGVLERGEKLGINQAVRGAVGEIRRNVEGLQAHNIPQRWGQTSMEYDQPTVPLAAMERRNRHLAAMLDETIKDLKTLAATRLDGDKEKHAESVELAAARIQFVKVYLEDSSLSFPDEEDMPAICTLSLGSRTDNVPTLALDATPAVVSSFSAAVVAAASSSPASSTNAPESQVSKNVVQDKHTPAAADPPNVDKMEIDLLQQELPLRKPALDTSIPSEPTPNLEPNIFPQALLRPQPSIPARSIIAQSSFAWMLEPDTTLSRSPRRHSTKHRQDNASEHSRSASANSNRRQATASREHNAFLFGEVTGGSFNKLSANEIFGLKTFKKGSDGRSREGGDGDGVEKSMEEAVAEEKVS